MVPKIEFLIYGNGFGNPVNGGGPGENKGGAVTPTGYSSRGDGRRGNNTGETDDARCSAGSGNGDDGTRSDGDDGTSNTDGNLENAPKRESS
jgi:hypothetical protein